MCKNHNNTLRPLEQPYTKTITPRPNNRLGLGILPSTRCMARKQLSRHSARTVRKLGGRPPPGVPRTHGAKVELWKGGLKLVDGTADVAGVRQPLRAQGRDDNGRVQVGAGREARLHRACHRRRDK